MSRLFEIADRYAQIFDQLDEITDEEIIDQWFDVLDSLEDEFEVKAESIAQYIKELEAKSDDIKVEEWKLKVRREAYENKAQRLKNYLKENMEKFSRKKIETPRAKILIRNNAPSLSIQNDAEFVRMLEKLGREELIKRPAPEIRRNDVKNLMKAGEVFDGAKLITTKSVIIS